MTRHRVSEFSPDVRERSWLRPLQVLSLLGPLSFAFFWMAFGIFAFFLIRAWGIEYDRKVALIQRGAVPPETLYVTRVFQNDDGRWQVSLGKAEREVAWRSTDDSAELPVGSAVTAYRFDQDYLIPCLDRGGHSWGKWVFLGFGLLPVPVFAGILLVRRLRGPGRQPQPVRSYGAGPVASDASGETAAEPVPVPPAFSLASQEFEDIPEDAQLVCLLGDRDCGPIRASEEAGLLTVRPWLFPMKFVVPWMVFTLLVITVLVMWFFSLRNPLLWAGLAMGWLGALPMFLGLLAVINRSFAKKGDYFRVDLARRTLELCRAGQTVEARQIVAITLLDRWYRHAGGAWDKTYQTGVLVRNPDNQVAHYPLVRELAENVSRFKKSRWAERLADIFQVPLRQIELSRSESRGLNDC